MASQPKQSSPNFKLYFRAKFLHNLLWGLAFILSPKALIAHWSETHTPTSGTQDVGRWFGWSLLSLSGIDYILCQADSGDDSKSLMRRQVCLLEGIMSTLASVFCIDFYWKNRTWGSLVSIAFLVPWSVWGSYCYWKNWPFSDLEDDIVED